MSETMLKRMAQAIRNHAPLLNEILAEELALAALRAIREPGETIIDAFSEAGADARQAARADNRARGYMQPDALADVQWVPQAWAAAIDAAIHEAENAK